MTYIVRLIETFFDVLLFTDRHVLWISFWLLTPCWTENCKKLCWRHNSIQSRCTKLQKHGTEIWNYYSLRMLTILLFF